MGSITSRRDIRNRSASPLEAHIRHGKRHCSFVPISRIYAARTRVINCCATSCSAPAWRLRSATTLIIAILAVPIVIQVYFNSGLACLLNRAAGEAHCVAAPSALIGASNFFE
jgi:hypothetical protein